MLHPDVVTNKSSIEGTGLFAEKKIPKGTVVWRFDSKTEKVYTKNQYNKLSKRYKSLLRHFAYWDEEGRLVYCTDNAKYWNHSCEPNVSRVDGIDIAIKDIQPGEELTYDYALLMSESSKPIKCNCGSKNCRRVISRDPKIIKNLHAIARSVLVNSPKVKQPLLKKSE